MKFLCVPTSYGVKERLSQRVLHLRHSASEIQVRAKLAHNPISLTIMSPKQYFTDEAPVRLFHKDHLFNKSHRKFLEHTSENNAPVIKSRKNCHNNIFLKPKKIS